MAKRIKNILVTGGAGFIGSEFVRQSVERGYRVSVVDALTYAGDRTRLKAVEGQYQFYKADIREPARLKTIFTREQPEAVVHFAAETHVDRSIQDAAPFIATNVQGTQNLIDVSRLAGIKKFVHISTDEVYGEIPRGRFTELSPLQPNNPYSATKAAADFLIKAAVRTHGFPAVIVRPSNNYGPWQYPEKLVPVVILKAMRGERVPVYGEGKNVREWLYVADSCRAVHTVLEKGAIGAIYNAGSRAHRPNIQTVRTLLRCLKKNPELIEFVRDRPGHDIRYAVDCRKLESLGWRTQVGFEEGMAHTVAWYQEHLKWGEGKRAFLLAYWKKVYQRGA